MCSRQNPESAFIGELAGLEAELFTVTEGLSSKAERWSAAGTTDTDDYVKASTDYGELYGNYNSLYGEFESVRQLIASYPADTARLLFEIQEKESALLQHEALTEDKKQQLEKIFNKTAASTDTDKLLAQYATLQQFEFTLDERGEGVYREELLKDDILTALLENVVEIDETELAGWDSVGEGIPETELGMSNLGSTFAAIMSGYQGTVEEQHSALLADLDAIDEQANILLAQIQVPSNMITEGEPVATTGEGEVMAGQQNVTTQLVSLSGLMNSLSDRQDGLVNYATDLHGKANDIKETSTVFSGKWQSNLDEMSLFKDDIQGFLGNTYVDGQENGYASIISSIHSKLKVRPQ